MYPLWVKFGGDWGQVVEMLGRSWGQVDRSWGQVVEMLAKVSAGNALSYGGCQPVQVVAKDTRAVHGTIAASKLLR